MNEATTIPNLLQKRSDRPELREILVLGLGNARLADDGVGVHVVRHLARDPETPPCLRPLSAGAFGFRLLSKLTKARAVLIVDAAELGAPPGTTCLLEREELALHISRGGRIGAHESGLVDLLTMGRVQNRLPRRLALLAVQPHSVDWSDDLSPPLAELLPQVCEEVVKTVLAWQEAA
jgi:hydrogenase maturation protease